MASTIKITFINMILIMPFGTEHKNKFLIIKKK